MWVAIPLNLVIVLLVLFLMSVIKLWMFDAPRPQRHIPAYSLHVNQSLPPDKPVEKTFQPYTKKSVPYTVNGRQVYSSAPVHNAPHKHG